MKRGLTYKDALKLAGAETSSLDLIDKLATSAILLLGDLNLLEAKTEIIHLSKGVVKQVRERVGGLNRMDRTARLEAAHAVIVVSAFFEALHEVKIPISSKQLKITAIEQVSILTGKSASSNNSINLAKFLLQTEVPTPDPLIPFSQTFEEIRQFYVEGAEALHHFVQGLVVWDEVEPYKREQFTRAVRFTLADAALRAYANSYRLLCVDCFEFYVWGRLYADSATTELIHRRSDDISSQISELKDALQAHGPALAGLHAFLRNFPDQISTANQLRQSLSSEYCDFLQRPIVETGDLPAGIIVPTLEESYITPPFRVHEIATSDDDPSRISWWSSVEQRNDMEAFLSGYLTSSAATVAPLLILGQPGSGKSVLAKMLSALLSPTHYFPIRVVLRDVGTEMDLIEQIEAGASVAANRKVEWPELSAAAGESMPVVLLDGFDELLQATGVSQSDYLMKVQDFQRREANKFKPVVFIITTRTAVANRAKFPIGTVAIHLEAFDDSQINNWLTVWNEANQAYFRSNNIKPLRSEIALANRDLAEQPLLLLMLALYDLNGNPLSSRKEGLGPVELYEGLLQQFARREVEKSLKGVSQREISTRVERELVKLSVVAFAMYNRGAQWVSDTDLDQDMATLQVETASPREVRMRTPLTPAELTVGRFFFIYEARATQDNKTLQTYEFLHATFAEFLVARLTFGILLEMAKRESAAESSFATIPVDYGRVHALLSFSPLTTRSAVTGFLREIVDDAKPSIRKALGSSLKRLLTEAQRARPDFTYASYEPRQATVTSRIAAYTANLIVLIIIVEGEFAITDWWQTGNEPRIVWSKLTSLWRAELREDEWTNLVKAITVVRGFSKEQATITLKICDEEPEDIRIDPQWLSERRRLRIDGAEQCVIDPPDVTYDSIARHAFFSCVTEENVVVHTLEPLAKIMGPAFTSFFLRPSGELVTGGHLLLAAWSAVTSLSAPLRVALYEECVIFAQDSPSWGADESRQYWSLLLAILEVDSEVPKDLLRGVVRKAIEQGVQGHIVFLGALQCFDMQSRDMLETVVAAANKLDDSDHAALLAMWLLLIEMDVDGATMIRIKGYGNAVPFLNQKISLPEVAKVNPGLVRRARWAMDNMGLADRISWPDGL